MSDCIHKWFEEGYNSYGCEVCDLNGANAYDCVMDLLSQNGTLQAENDIHEQCNADLVGENRRVKEAAQALVNQVVPLPPFAKVEGSSMIANWYVENLKGLLKALEGSSNE